MTPEHQKRIDELKACEGKTYLRKDGTELPTKILKYDGTRMSQSMEAGGATAIVSHVFQVESSDGRRWTPPATKFLAEHDEIPTSTENATANQIQ